MSTPGNIKLRSKKKLISPVQDLIHTMIKHIGDDPSREGLLDTPRRVEKMWDQFFVGYKQEAPKLTLFQNGKDGVHYEDMIIDRGYYFSFCEHHLLPFFGSYYFGYIPGDFIVGASKIARTIDYFAGRLQVAERLVKQVADHFEKHLNPRGLILVMDGRHLCKEMRGVKKFDTTFEVIAVRGLFASHEHTCKEEFLLRIK